MQKMLSTIKWFRAVFAALDWRIGASAALAFGLSTMPEAAASTVFDVTEIGTNLSANIYTFNAINNRSEAAGGRTFSLEVSSTVGC